MDGKGNNLDRYRQLVKRHMYQFRSATLPLLIRKDSNGLIKIWFKTVTDMWPLLPLELQMWAGSTQSAFPTLANKSVEFLAACVPDKFSEHERWVAVDLTISLAACYSLLVAKLRAQNVLPSDKKEKQMFSLNTCRNLSQNLFGNPSQTSVIDAILNPKATVPERFRNPKRFPNDQQSTARSVRRKT